MSNFLRTYIGDALTWILCGAVLIRLVKVEGMLKTIQSQVDELYRTKHARNDPAPALWS